MLEHLCVMQNGTALPLALASRAGVLGRVQGAVGCLLPQALSLLREKGQQFGARDCALASPGTEKGDAA